MTHPLNERQKEHLNAYLEDISENGQINEKIEAKIARIYWKI